MDVSGSTSKVYHTLQIRIFAPTESSQPDSKEVTYPAELNLVGWRYFPKLAIRIDKSALDPNLDPKDCGIKLGKMLFADDALGSSYRETIAAVHGRGDELRVRLWIEPPELYELRWERIYHQLGKEWYSLGSTGTTPFSRYIPLKQWKLPSLVAEYPLRMLVVIASPSNLSQYSLDPIGDEERQALHNMLDQQPNLSVDYLETGTDNPPSLNQIRKALARGYHLVHFLCHGAVKKGSNALYLEKEGGKDDRQVDRVETERLIDMFKLLATPPLLCFLAACESATRGRHDAFMPLGPALVENGKVPAVIAMTDKVGIETAQCFTEQFYTGLTSHNIIDLAMNEARAYVQEKWDWSVPVLFSCLPDDQSIAQLKGDATPFIQTKRYEPETILIPAGPFLMGTTEEQVEALVAEFGESRRNEFEREVPQHLFKLPTYRIGKYPVTNKEYAKFIKHDKQHQCPDKQLGWSLRNPPANKLDHPVVGVSWHDALAYCEWLSGQTDRHYRLPTEAEWEKAARGMDDRLYPWGDEWEAERCNADGVGTTPKAAHPKGASPYGCYDMVGNVQEWTSTIWHSDFGYPYRDNDDRDDLNADEYKLRRIHRGGSFRDKQNRLRCSARGYSSPSSKNPWRGFRVVLEV